MPPGPPRRRGLIGWWRRRRRFVRWLLATLLVFVFLLLVLFGAAAYIYMRVPVPEKANIVYSSVITDEDGQTEIARIGSVNRQDVKLAQVPPDVRNAVLAAEDRNFYSEPGVSVPSIMRALWANVTGGEVAQGGSTITQQFVKNAYLSSDRTLSRKVREIVIAVKLDRKYTKDQILELYLNTIYFGRGAYGISSAARIYFGTDVEHLTLDQGALLAGLIRAPSALDPRANPQGADARFHQVLGAMAEAGWVDRQHADTATPPLTFPLTASGVSAATGPQAAYIREEVKRELSAAGLSETDLARGGYRITTTLDPAMQAAAVKSVENTLSGAPSNLQTAIVSVEPGTGRIRAYYPGDLYGRDQDGRERYIDNITQQTLPPGSSFKPVALVAALNKGIPINAAYDGRNRLVLPGYPDGVRNFGDESFGQVSLPTALANSINSVFVKLGLDAGLANVADMAHQLGIPASTQLAEVPSLPLGSQYVRPLDLAGVYATLAARGIASTPHLVETVTDRSGAVVFRGDDGGRQVIPQRVVDDATYALEQVVQNGTGTGAQLAGGRAAAGKTGTTEGNLSALFAGYTPQLATVVAMFRPGNLPLQNILGYGEVTGGTLPATLWSNYMNSALEGQPLLPFPDPPDPIRPTYTSYPGNPDSGATSTPADTPAAGPPVSTPTPQDVLPSVPATSNELPRGLQSPAAAPSASPTPTASSTGATSRGRQTNNTTGGRPAGTSGAGAVGPATSANGGGNNRGGAGGVGSGGR
ncbi:MAG: transglycosylase domain-containing protein [Frankiaceae bacterium]